nr:rRNA-processing protein FYV7 [Leptinotarsa decemlineata]
MGKKVKNEKNQVVPKWRPQNKDTFPEKTKKNIQKPQLIKHENNRSDASSSGFKKFFIRRSEARNKNLRKVPVMTSENQQEQQPSAESRSEATKKPFDKKKYRLKKYSKKYKLDQWEERRKAAISREYYKQIKNDGPAIDVSKIYNDPRNRDSDDEHRVLEENENNLNAGIVEEESPFVENPPRRKLKPFERAQQEFQRLKDEKQRKVEEFLRKKAEKEAALKKYRKEKAEKFKKLSRRTKKGQPIMNDRMEMLLEKIQNSLK